ncbi:MAG: chromosomal replication initiator DnaA [Methylophilales bacterium BACL14 MAG-120910-bin43]|nr:MAG: chromosomal replication initiator DnaA [Methylophilales bacterium BACL14 MAG-120910-bin43]
MTPEETWKLCLNFCEKELSKQQYTTWIKPLSGDVDEKLKQLTISAPNQFVLQWVKERLNDKLHSLLEESSNISSITYNVNKKTKRSLSVEAIITESPDPNKIKPVKTNGLNKSFNFDNFVTGKANQLACAAAKQIAEKPGTTYNPLFVYGGVGLGKTHLMHAIGNHLKSIQPNAKIKYLHAERYVHDVVKAYENKDFDSFKKNYHSLDLLLIDDIQFIAKKNRTQEEFFYAFNSLIENKKQIIITCDSYPKEIVGVDERLRTRFSWGLTVSIDPPELEMRVAILLKKAAGNKIQLSEEVAFFVAKQIRSNVRELEGALNRIVAMSNFTGREIDLSLAKESLKDLIAVRGRQISVENIQKTVADFYKIKIADIHSKKRSRNYSRPRQIAMSLTRELTNLSFPEIGEAFGGRHHTTIMHACDEIESLRLSDQAIGQDLGFLTQVLKG